MLRKFRNAIAGLAAAAMSVGDVQAQQTNGSATPSAPQADSATAARAAYRRAITAYRQRDLPTARAEMRRAAESWPTQQVYMESAASLAAVARDTSDAAAWLERLAMLGVGSSVAGDTSFNALVGAATFDSAVAHLKHATAPIVNGRVAVTVADTTFHPEGIAFDAKTGRWFVGSVRQRRIVAVERGGATRDFVSSGADGIAGVFGMAADVSRRTLWVATTALARMTGFSPADSGRVGVFGYDMDSGALRRRAWLRPDSAAHTFGDVAVAPNGDVYVSDSESPWILKVPRTGDTLERFMTHPLFRSLQGMAITPDGAAMYVADYSHGIMRVDLAARTATALRAAPGVTLLGIDGLYLHDGALVAVQNGVTPARVVRFCLDRDGRGVQRAEVLDRNPAVADEPTLGAVVGDSVFYVATSQWEKFDDAGKRRSGTVARPVTILGAPLASARACAAP